MTKNGTFPFIGRALGGIVGGILGYVFGVLLVGMDIFPSLEWANIFLFLGLIVGFFKNELAEYFGN